MSPANLRRVNFYIPNKPAFFLLAVAFAYLDEPVCMFLPVFLDDSGLPGPTLLKWEMAGFWIAPGRTHFKLSNIFCIINELKTPVTPTRL